ncbi:transcriptional regulator AraC family protein [Vibrio ichthyoenteri ATCC 700023]|uniref:Transcriptional regulator AraC family protein n=1 Tax=Vibrio ichthyoenteri ATCC 700023 TaxID=870968 RepID=F9RWX9_9VIBR|nr:AraC family transcriptional regulator [Vibrio ichthyoenteri]EGU48893.1 transcriptional regulator AraC family protein [Vibrio ichthyoenteri ATCC 700023]
MAMHSANTLIVNFGRELALHSPYLYKQLQKNHSIQYLSDNIAHITNKKGAIYIFYVDNNNLLLLEQAIIICKNLKKKLIILQNEIDPLQRRATNIFTLSLQQPNYNERLQLLLKLCHPSLHTTGLPNHLTIDSIPLYIEQNLASPINESETAQIFGYISSYFSKLFFKHFGQTFNAYVTHARIDHAKRLLTQRQQSKIAHIAYCCGFNDASYFSKVFKKETGTTPAAYRQSY